MLEKWLNEPAKKEKLLEFDKSPAAVGGEQIAGPTQNLAHLWRNLLGLVIRLEKEIENQDGVAEMMAMINKAL